VTTRFPEALCVVLVLTGCAATGPNLPEPPALPGPALCDVPVGMTEREPMPARPRGEYSQKDVAEYLARLHRHATRGWLRVVSIQEWSALCSANATSRGRLTRSRARSMPP